ncbi:MAG: hypothetical protein RSD27_10355 [Ruthenibacterium sp.]
MDENESGVLEQETAAPANIENVSEEIAENGGETGAADQPQETEQPREDVPDRVWEIARKRAQREAQQRLAARDRQFAERFKGVINPATNQPIQSEEDYFAALDAQESLRVQERLTEKGIDPGLLNDAVQRNPVVQAAGKMLEQVQREDGERQFDAQFSEIRRIDPSVTDLAALQKTEGFAEFDRMVRGGMDMVSAYKLANFDKLTAQKTQAAQQAAINAAKGKQHLAPASGGVSTGDMTEDDLQLWSQMGFTKEQAVQYHNKYKEK